MEQQNSIFESGLSHELKQELANAANWGKIVAIIGFCGAAAGFFVNLSKGSIFGGLISVAFAVVINVFMYRFGNNTSNSIKSSDQGELIEGVSALKTYFKISAIIILIVLILAVLAFLFGVLGAAIGRL